MEQQDKTETTEEPSSSALLTKELETLCSAIPPAIARTGKDLSEQYYDRLAEEAMGPKWENGVPGEKTRRLLDAAQDELGHLHHAMEDLARSYQSAMEVADELSARMRDVHTSRNRKWYAPNPPANAAIDLEEKQQNHFARGLNFYKISLICFSGSFFGVVIEMLWCLITNGYIESRAGLVYGPFNLLYGAGAAAITLFLYQYRNRGYFWSFVGGFFVGSVLEYLCSLFQELLLGSRSWDYSHMPLNINGRICFAYSLFWGVLGVFWIKDLYPRIAKWILKIPNRIGRPLTWFLTIFLTVNALVSCVAVGRWANRVENQPPANAFWEMIDERFPDKRMEQIFANMTFGS